MCTLGLSGFPGLQLDRCILGVVYDWLPLLGVHSRVTLVKLIMIGYHCNHLDGQHNCLASTHWLIIMSEMYRRANHLSTIVP